jgi:hypothetical protein
VVEKAVQQGGRDHGMAEHLAPLGKAPVRGQDQGALLVAGVRSSFILSRLLAVTSNI